MTHAAKATAVGTGKAAKLVTRKVIAASKANGAHESGLTALIWNQVLSYGTDAMITVALASTVFFGASTHAQRGNVLLYLLVTMAPFAVVAPFIGPALDRVQHGRRWAMAGSAAGRAVLAVIMAGHSTDLLVLYPCALGSLVFSKAYSVVRSAAGPRLVPPGMTLVEANARLSIFGLGAALIGGGFVGIVIKLTGSDASRSVGHRHRVRGVRILRDQAAGAGRLGPAGRATSRGTRPATRPGEGPTVLADHGLGAARLPAAGDHLAAGRIGAAVHVRVPDDLHGVLGRVHPARMSRRRWPSGAVVGAAGVGNFLGTAIGARLKLSRPERVISLSIGIAGVAALLTGLVFSIDFAVVGMLLVAAANALGKIALDAVIQRDVAETLRSSAFARSETFLQLAWVLGAAIGCLLPARQRQPRLLDQWGRRGRGRGLPGPAQPRDEPCHIGAAVARYAR